MTDQEAQRAKWREEYQRRRDYFRMYAIEKSDHRKELSRKYRQENREKYNAAARDRRTKDGATPKISLTPQVKKIPKPAAQTSDELKSRFLAWKRDKAAQ
jgi:hypothetical protein